MPPPEVPEIRDIRSELPVVPVLGIGCVEQRSEGAGEALGAGAEEDDLLHIVADAAVDERPRFGEVGIQVIDVAATKREKSSLVTEVASIENADSRTSCCGRSPSAG